MPEPAFFLGRIVEVSPGGTSAKPPEDLHYAPADLTTHAAIIGMTGSGKTGLLITLLEEAALQGIPAIIIDPKGDLANLCLHFQSLSPQALEPWVDTEEARRKGITPNALAAQTAQKWQTGWADWGISPDRSAELTNTMAYSVYTPGSSASQPVNLLSSFAPPPVDWETNKEALREQIASTVTALLALAGLTAVVPLRSREHILLSNIIETAWKQRKPLDLAELILQVQSPPFERLGAFPVNQLFPEKDRMELALTLNNFLVSPSFQVWMEGVNLDAHPTRQWKPESIAGV